jgi:ribosome-binding factor A
MSSEIRQKRLAGLLFEELNIMIGHELDDPKLKLVNVTDVVVSKDMRNVKVFVSHQDEEVPKQVVIAHLRRAAPYLRSQLAERLTLRLMPELTFHYDESNERALRLSEIFQQIASERATKTVNLEGSVGL